MASYSDNFDRANGEIGANWIEDAGDIDIVSNVAETQTADVYNRARYSSQLDSSDHYVQATIGGKDGSNCGSIQARQASSTMTCYDFFYVEYGAAEGYRLYAHENENWNQIDSAASGSGAVVLRLDVDGSSIIGYAGGIEK